MKIYSVTIGPSDGLIGRIVCISGLTQPMPSSVAASAHFVETPCNCGDIEHCAMAKYIADIRIAFDEIERLTVLLDGGRGIDETDLAA